MCEAQTARSATETWTLVQGLKRNRRPAGARTALFNLIRKFQSCKNPNPESRVRRPPIYETGAFSTRIALIATLFICSYSTEALPQTVEMYRGVVNRPERAKL